MIVGYVYSFNLHQNLHCMAYKHKDLYGMCYKVKFELYVPSYSSYEVLAVDLIEHSHHSTELFLLSYQCWHNISFILWCVLIIWKHLLRFVHFLNYVMVVWLNVLLFLINRDRWYVRSLSLWLFMGWWDFLLFFMEFQLSLFLDWDLELWLSLLQNRLSFLINFV